MPALVSHLFQGTLLKMVYIVSLPTLIAPGQMNVQYFGNQNKLYLYFVLSTMVYMSLTLGIVYFWIKKNKKRADDMKKMSFSKISWSLFFTIVMMSFLSASNALLHTSKDSDIIRTQLYSNFSVIFTQSMLLLLMSWQVLNFRAINFLVAIRGQSEKIQKQMIKTIIFEVIIYFSFYYGSFMLSGNIWFKDGYVLIGIMILLMRAFIILFLGMIITSLYRGQHIAIIIVAVQLSNFVYHFFWKQRYYWYNIVHYMIQYIAHYIIFITYKLQLEKIHA